MKPGDADLRQDQINHIKLLYESKDWEGLLQLESTVTRIAHEIETTDPSEAGGCYLYLGTAHKDLGTRESDIEPAIVCLQKLSKWQRRRLMMLYKYGACSVLLNAI